MEVKLHNKYEIISGTQTYTAYNTITHKIFDCVKELKQYATYMAFGNGQGNSEDSFSYQNHKLNNYMFSYPTTLEEICCDPTKSQMFVKRTAVIPGDQFNNNYFCELGLTNTSDSNPDIFTHVKVTDKDNNLIFIQKKEGQTLLVRVTIYLEIEEGKGMLTAGDNLLVKGLLGELSTPPTITAYRGLNYLDNSVSIPRSIPRNGVAHTAELITDQPNSLEIDFDLGTGGAVEAVICFNDQPVVRCNLIQFAPEYTSTYTSPLLDSRTVLLPSFVKSLDSISLNGEPCTGYTLKPTSYTFGDYIKDPFDVSVTDTTPRFVSKTGDKIGFVVGGAFHLYINKNYSLYKVANDIQTENIKDVIMFEDYVFVIYSVAPYFKVYTLSDYALSQVQTDFSVYNAFDTTYDWMDVHVINDDNGNFTIGIILSEQSRRPVVLTAKFVNNQFKILTANYGTCDHIANMFSIYKSFCNDSMIGFITDNYDPVAGEYRIEEHWADGTVNIGNEIYAYAMINQTASLKGVGRMVVARKTEPPYVWLFCYPDLFRYSISLSDGVANWISPNLSWYIQKYNDIVNKKYVLYEIDNPSYPYHFDGGMPEDLNLDEVTDFEFLEDSLVIFTSTGVKVINFMLNRLRVENLPLTEDNFSITTTYANPVGSDADEGVFGSFFVEFNV